MPAVSTGYLEDDFCANLKVMLDAGVAATTIPKIREVHANIPIADNGPHPSLFINWISTQDGDKTEYAWPTILKHRIIRARLILVNTTFDRKANETECRQMLRKIANYIEAHTTINDFCQTAVVNSVESGETAFMRSAGVIVSHGAIEVTGEAFETITHS